MTAKQKGVFSVVDFSLFNVCLYVLFDPLKPSSRMYPIYHYNIINTANPNPNKHGGKVNMIVGLTFQPCLGRKRHLKERYVDVSNYLIMQTE